MNIVIVGILCVVYNVFMLYFFWLMAKINELNCFADNPISKRSITGIDGSTSAHCVVKMAFTASKQRE